MPITLQDLQKQGPIKVISTPQANQVGDGYSFFNEVKNSFNNRVNNTGKILEDTASGEINPASTGIQTVGQGAGLINDIIGAGFMAIIGESGRKTVGSVAQSVVNTKPVSDAIQSWQQFKQQHPEAAGNIEGTVNLASLLWASKGATKVGSSAKQGAINTGEKVAAKSAGALETAGAITEKTGEAVYKSSIPLSDVEAGLMQTYKAKNPLMNRIMGEVKNKPITARDTALKYGIQGTESQMGVQANRISTSLWDEIKTSVKSISEKYKVNEGFTRIEKQISKEAEAGRRTELKEALDALKDDYKYIPQLSFERAQSVKSGISKFTPDKYWKGKPIGSAYKEVKELFADDIRQQTYNVLRDENIRAKYIDWGNLQDIKAFGRKAMTGAGTRGGFGNWISSLKDMATVPVQTVGGKILNDAGKAIKNLGKNLKK